MKSLVLIVLSLMLISLANAQESTCANSVWDGLESDVDCGGANCPGCTGGKVCWQNTDCDSGTCDIGHCTGAVQQTQQQSTVPVGQATEFAGSGVVGGMTNIFSLAALLFVLVITYIVYTRYQQTESSESPKSRRR